MNDVEIRKNFHRKKLRIHHAHADTLVIDELGLNHGKCRADIAVINGHFVGYEIKSNKDSLRRLERQVNSYNSVFDRASIIVGNHYVDSISDYIPEWWGIIVTKRGKRGAIGFDMIRKPQTNKYIDPVCVAQLLWRNEVSEILSKKEMSPKSLRKPRAVLYEHLANMLTICELRKTVRDYLKKRKNWRYPGATSRYDGLCQPVATS